MIVGLGIDIEEVSRVRGAIERYGENFLNRVFTPQEIAYCSKKRNPYERYAARFAAKEAGMKALGTGWRRGITWRDFEVSHAPGGRPILKLSGVALEIYGKLGGTNIALSLSHTANQAMAEVIIEGQGVAGASDASGRSAT
jgi:holo-[acyl-carrier protein] synthase